MRSSRPKHTSAVADDAVEVVTDASPAGAAVDLEKGAPANASEAGAEPVTVTVPYTPAVYGVAAVLALMSLVSYGVTGEGAVAAVAAAALAVLAAIDLEYRLLPNRIVLPTFLLVLVGRMAFNSGDAVEYLLAGPAAALFLALPLAIRRDAMGFGDIKLALLLGATVGWAVFGAIFVASLAIVPVALAMLVRDRSLRDATLPFGPFLAFGTLFVLYASA